MHWRIQRATKAVRQATHQRFARRKLPISCEGGIVSFTFDDIPQSAASVGSKVLENYGISGTFYLAGALTDTKSKTEPYHSGNDVVELIGRGHEIGCHTFGHRLVSDLNVTALRDELSRNQRWMTMLVPDYALCSFAYPQGAVSVTAKRLLGRQFSSCRWNQPGINAGSVDVSLLRANKIYSHLDNVTALEALIDANRARGGWLIFYTHDVSNSPSLFGCSPVDFEKVVACAAKSGSKVLSVRNALGALAFSF